CEFRCVKLPRVLRNQVLRILEVEQALLETLTTQTRLVLTALPGFGKSTRVPQMLLDGGLLGDGQVTILQPRRLPTRMLAAWLAQARNAKLGGEVGYQDAAGQRHVSENAYLLRDRRSAAAPDAG